MIENRFVAVESIEFSIAIRYFFETALSLRNRLIEAQSSELFCNFANSWPNSRILALMLGRMHPLLNTMQFVIEAEFRSDGNDRPLQTGTIRRSIYV